MKIESNCYRLVSRKLKNLGENIDSIWRRNVPFARALSSENHMDDNAVCAKARTRLHCLKQLSVSGGWFFSESCMPVCKIDDLCVPDKLTFSFSSNRKSVTTQIIGIPPHSESRIREFISIVMSSQFRFLLQYEELESLAFDRAAVQYATNRDVGIVYQIFEGDDILINRWGLRCHDDMVLSDVNFVVMPVSRFQYYDETEPYLYYVMDDVMANDSVLGAIFRHALKGSSGLQACNVTSAPHLGGHFNRTNMDKGALDIMIDKCHVRSLIDVGCGTGGMVAYAKWKGLDAIGIDGDGSLPHYSYMICHDFTISSLDSLPPKDFDLLWTVEFLEHIEECFLANLRSIFRKARYVISTAAPSGQYGYHHVNCQDERYWRDWFENLGFDVDKELTATVRHCSTMRSNFMRNNGVVWRRR